MVVFCSSFCGFWVWFDSVCERSCLVHYMNELDCLFVFLNVSSPLICFYSGVIGLSSFGINDLEFWD